MSVSETSDSPQLKLIHEWQHAFNQRNIDLIAKPLHKDHRCILYPKSIGKAEKTREEWLASFAETLGYLDEYESIWHSIIEAPGKIVIHATNKAKSKTGVDLTRESIYIVHLVTDEDESLKIKVLEEFTDSKAYLDINQALVASLANK